MLMKLCVSLLIMRLGGQDFRVYSSKKSQLMFSHFAAVPAVALAAFLVAPKLATAASRPASFARALMIAQDDSTADEEAIPTDQVDKYIAVYSAMQKNHSLSVEQAASKQGLTVDEFRTLEDKIERNPVVHERVLDALRPRPPAKKPRPARTRTSARRLPANRLASN